MTLVAHGRCTGLRGDSWWSCYTPSMRLIAARLGAAGLLAPGLMTTPELIDYWANVVRHLEARS